ncbi:hypothetical protein, partial [Streptomyces alboviridis]|uniref:hypothetical protein n=1 Tax=Streptomyces alboviridis TaxID=67269 RepID=UPI00131A5E70
VMHDSSARLADVTRQHRLQGDQDSARCADCGITVWRRLTPRHEPGPREWLAWLAPDGRDWSSFPEGDGWVTWPNPEEGAPSCPPQDVEAKCPWEENARRYGRAWGDVQLQAAMRTWCDTHQCVVSDCPEPGPYCPGWQAHEEGEPGRPGPCTGREDSCKCMCPACCGDTPDVWGYDGDY